MVSVFYLIIFLFAAIVHEVAHGAMAYKLGDPTAKESGRLTLNPLKHIDPFGSIVLPLILFLLRSPILFGWAKPVPFNPVFLKRPKRDSGLIALAGPVSNFVIAAVFFGILLANRMFGLLPIPNLGEFLTIIVQVNIWLGIINLVPIPPLDGSKVLFAILPRRMYPVEVFLEKNGPMLLMILLLILMIFF